MDAVSNRSIKPKVLEIAAYYTLTGAAALMLGAGIPMCFIRSPSCVAIFGKVFSVLGGVGLLGAVFLPCALNDRKIEPSKEQQNSDKLVVLVGGQRYSIQLSSKTSQPIEKRLTEEQVVRTYLRLQPDANFAAYRCEPSDKQYCSCVIFDHKGYEYAIEIDRRHHQAWHCDIDYSHSAEPYKRKAEIPQGREMLQHYWRLKDPDCPLFKPEVDSQG